MQDANRPTTVGYLRAKPLENGTDTSKRRRLIPALLFTGLVAGLALSSARRSEWSLYNQGANPLHHLLDLGLVVTLGFVCLSTGQLLWGRTRTFQEVLAHPLERVVFLSALGAGVVASWILLGIAILGVQPVSLALLLAPLLILASARFLEVTRSLFRAWEQLFIQAGPAPITVFGLVVAFLLLQSLAPPTDWDALVYHLQVPRQFLEVGRIHVPDDNHHVAFVGLLHMLYLPLLAFGSSAGPSILSAFYAILLGCAVLSFCSRFFGRLTGRLGLMTLWGTTSLILVAVTPRVDTTLTLFLFLAHYALLIGLIESSSRPLLLLAGVLLGFAVGIKYHALAYTAALGPLILLSVYRHGKGSRNSLRLLGMFVLLLLLSASPWIAKNALLLDAPFYPALTERKLEPWLADLAGREEMPPSVSPDVFRGYAEARERFNLLDFIAAPGRLTVEPEGPLYFTNPILLLTILAVFFWRDKVIGLLLGPAVLYLVLVIVPSPTTNIRYLIPAIPALTIVGLETGVRSSARFSFPLLRRVSRGAMAVLGIAPTVVVIAVLLSQVKTLGYAFGTVTRDEYLVSYPIAGFPSYWSQVRFANENNNANARTLMLFEARGYYFDVPVLQDNVMTNWPLLVATGATESCLRGTDIQHLIVGTGGIAYFLERGADPGPLRWDLFPSFAERCLTTMHQAPGIVAYRVRSATRPSPASSP